MTVTGEDVQNHRRPSDRRRMPRPRGPEVPDTPEALDHAAEAEEIRVLLREEFGVEPQQVAPTLNFEGHIRMTFDDLDKILDVVDNLRKELKTAQSSSGMSSGEVG